MLKYTSIFNNFGAESFNLIPDPQGSDEIFTNIDHSTLALSHLNNIQSIFIALNQAQYNQMLAVYDVILDYRTFLSWAISFEMEFSTKKTYVFLVNQQFFNIVEDARPFLLQLKKLSLNNISVKLIIFLQEATHAIRNFNKNTLIKFLLACGFEIEDKSTYLSVVINKKNYIQYLQSNGITGEIIKLKLRN